jgi:hypothetical protein
MLVRYVALFHLLENQPLTVCLISHCNNCISCVESVGKEIKDYCGLW